MLTRALGRSSLHNYAFVCQRLCGRTAGMLQELGKTSRLWRLGSIAAWHVPRRGSAVVSLIGSQQAILVINSYALTLTKHKNA